MTLLVPGLLAAGALAGAGAAAAEENPQLPGGATATLGGLETYGQAVVREDGVEREVPAGLFEMSVDGGGMLKTYCIDIDSPTQQDARYRETSWSATSLSANKQAGKIRWILQNSYPQVNDLAELARKAGAAGLTESDAAAGTQVAIWRHSDGVDVSALDPQAERLADYLQKKARNMGEPKASLTLDPPAVSGRAGERVGPVTVHTDARSVAVNPPADAAASGVKVVGEDGRPLTSAADGSELYFDLPKGGAGKAALTVQASTSVPVGRAFVSETRSQTQILAGSSESTVSATATVNWAEKGAIPALSAEPDCAAGGLDITAVNQGDREFTFSLMGFEHTIAAGEARTVTIPLQEDQAYDFTITGPNGFAERFKGVLDCRTEASGAAAGNDIAPQSAPSPATAGGTTTHDLAETGSSNATPMIAGIAVGFLVLGGVVVFLLRKKGGAAESGE